jgi:hypothetical protein
MRKILIASALAFSLAGCSTLSNIETAVEIGTASITNPVTRTRLDQMESGIKLVFIGLGTWKNQCANGNLVGIEPNCKEDIGAVQVYTRKVPPYLIQLRSFVRNNDQVNATVVWNQLFDIINIVKTEAAKGGVRVSTTGAVT